MPALLLVLLVAVVLVAALAVTVIVALYVYLGSILRALPPAPPPRQEVDCVPPSGAQPTEDDPDVILTGNEADSDIRGNTITLPAGTSFNFPPTNLTLVAYGDLTIDGRIPILLGSGGRLTLVSLTGTVTIGLTAVIGPGPVVFSGVPAATGCGLYALALGAPGATAEPAAPTHGHGHAADRTVSRADSRGQAPALAGVGLNRAVDDHHRRDNLDVPASVHQCKDVRSRALDGTSPAVETCMDQTAMRAPATDIKAAIPPVGRLFTREF